MCLTYLIEQKMNIVGVFINDETNETKWYQGESVEEIAEKNKISVYHKMDAKLMLWLNPDIIISVYYDHIIKKDPHSCWFRVSALHSLLTTSHGGKQITF